jgi:hypothetical protein
VAGSGELSSSSPLVFQALDDQGYLFEPLFFNGSLVRLAFGVAVVFDALQGGTNLL